ncbi:MAG: hypothetical protein V8T10_05385 [Merdibacter sp.]
MIQALEEAGATGEARTGGNREHQLQRTDRIFTFDATHTPIKPVLVVNLVDGVQVNPVEVDPNSNDAKNNK